MARELMQGNRSDRPAPQPAVKPTGTNNSPVRASRLSPQRTFDSGSLSHADIRNLQRTIGNNSTLRLLSPKNDPLTPTRAHSDIVQRKFRVSGIPNEFRDAQSVETYRLVVMAEIQKKRRKNDPEAIFDHIKLFAINPDDMQTADSWETVIQKAEDELDDEAFMDEDSPTQEEVDEDNTIYEDSDDEKGEFVDPQKITMGPMVRLGSWNPEKLGKSTKAAIREEKKSHTLNALDTYNPAFLGMMEISNAPFFMQGTPYKPGITKASVDFYDEEGVRSLKDNREFAKTKREEKLGYKPSDTYGMYEGPRFESGGYGENYPAMYNTSQIIGAPTAFTVDLATKQRLPFDPSKTQAPIAFSSDQMINRRLVVWKLVFNASPYSFRPVYDREIPIVTFYVGVVHTSPSIDIKVEIRSILDIAQGISDTDNIPMVIVGDFYMQRSAKEIWASLQIGKEGEWQMVHPKRNTNFPHKGEGQIADHSVFNSDAFTNASSFSVPPLEDSFQPISYNPPDIKQRKYEKYYTGMGADHTTVFNDFSLDLNAFPETTYTKPRPEEKH